jgi:ArsR family transcriptional regulator
MPSPVPPEDRLDELHADLCKVFTNPVRIRILNALRRGERGVNELAEAIGVSQSHASQHLTVMRAKGVVAARREGTRVFYRLANPKILDAFDAIRAVLLEALRESRLLARGVR